MELRDYIKVIRARMWMIIQVTLIVTITAVVISLLQSKQYQSQARVLISESDTGAAIFGTVLPEFSSQPERGLLTQVQLMQLRPLAENTIRQLGLEATPDELLEDLQVNAEGQTNVVDITAVGDSPEQAADIANTMAAEYVAWSRETKRESIKAAADEVQSRLDQTKSEILTLASRIQAEGKTDDLAAELQIATGTYTTLAEKLEQLRINEQLEVGSGRVVSPAVLESVAVAPKPVRNALLGIVIGLSVGLGMAFLYEYLDDTLKTTEQAEKIFAAPVLGTIPMEKQDKSTKRRLTILDSPGSSAAEAYRVLRNSLDFINFEHDMRTLLVSSAAPAEGKSTVCANLAVSLAQAGKKVVLVSCDFRRPTTDQFFQVNNIIGLSDVLLGTHTLKAALQQVTDDQLLVLTAGKMPPNPSELLSSAKMESLVQELKEWADWVIIDSPPLLAVADPASVARWADGVLIVTRAGASTRGAAKKAVELLSMVGARIIGVAVWGLDEGKASSQYGYYGHYAGGRYYYSSYYSQPTQRSRLKKSSQISQSSGDSEWQPPEPTAHRAADIMRRVLAALLGLLVVLSLLASALYFLSQYRGLDVSRFLHGLIGG